MYIHIYLYIYIYTLFYPKKSRTGLGYSIYNFLLRGTKGIKGAIVHAWRSLAVPTPSFGQMGPSQGIGHGLSTVARFGREPNPDRILLLDAQKFNAKGNIFQFQIWL